MNERDLSAVILARATAARLAIEPSIAARLAAYYQLLATWNEKINLSGMDLRVPTPEAIDRLILEPVAAARYASTGARVIDIGSGGGSPAVPFCVAASASYLRMVESKARKSVFLKEALRVVGLAGDVQTARFEDLLPAAPAFDILTVRAVRLDAAALDHLQQTVAADGRLLLFRAEPVADSEVPPSLQVSTEADLLPGARSHLTILSRR